FCSGGMPSIWTPEEMMKLKSVADVQISPDHTQALFLVTEAMVDKNAYSGSIYKAELDGSEAPSRFIFSEGSCFRPRWSPTGQWIAFLSDRTGVRQLYLTS